MARVKLTKTQTAQVTLRYSCYVDINVLREIYRDDPNTDEARLEKMARDVRRGSFNADRIQAAIDRQGLDFDDLDVDWELESQDFGDPDYSEIEIDDESGDDLSEADDDNHDQERSGWKSEKYDIDERITGYTIDLKKLPDSVSGRPGFDPADFRNNLSAHLSGVKGSAHLYVTSRNKVYVGYGEGQTPEDMWNLVEHYFGEPYVAGIKATQKLKPLLVFGDVTRTYRVDDDWRFAIKIVKTRKRLGFGVYRFVGAKIVGRCLITKEVLSNSGIPDIVIEQEIMPTIEHGHFNKTWGASGDGSALGLLSAHGIDVANLPFDEQLGDDMASNGDVCYYAFFYDKGMYGA